MSDDRIDPEVIEVAAKARHSVFCELEPMMPYWRDLPERVRTRELEVMEAAIREGVAESED